MPRQFLRLVKAKVQTYGTRLEVFRSLAEALQCISQNSTKSLCLIYEDEKGDQVELVFSNIEYSNLPSFLSGRELTHPGNQIDLPAEPPVDMIVLSRKGTK